MNVIALIALAGVIACWGGYRLAARFPVAGIVAAMALLVGAWQLSRLDLRPGTLADGAPSGAVAFLGMLMLAEWSATMLAGTTLLGSWRGAGNRIAAALFVVVFVPVALFIAYGAMQTLRPSAPSASRAAPRDARHDSIAAPAAPSGSRMDGYIWAIDSHFLDDSECRGTSAVFVDGCKAGVAKNRARPH